MSKDIRMVPLGEVLTKAEEWITLEPEKWYREVTVRLWGKGVVQRREVSGAEIAARRRLVVRSQQFILSRIDARNGALGLVPDSLDGAVVSNDFPVFTPNHSRILPAFLDWLSKTRRFVDLCKAASEGTTNRVRLVEDRFLATQIPLPPLPEQRQIVARIEELASKIEEARALRSQAVEARTAIIGLTVSRIDAELRASHKTACLAELVSKDEGAIRSGPFGSSLLHSEFVEEGVPAVGIEDVQENRFVLSRRWHVTPEKAAELARFRIRPGDVLITVMGTLGRTCVVPHQIPHMISTKHIWTLTLNHDLAFGPWVSYWLNYSTHVRRKLLGETTGTAIAGLNGKKIRAVSLPLIPLPEQRRIVAYLDDMVAKMDALKRLQTETAAELDAMLPSVLDRAFSGEL